MYEKTCPFSISSRPLKKQLVDRKCVWFVFHSQEPVGIFKNRFLSEKSPQIEDASYYNNGKYTLNVFFLQTVLRLQRSLLLEIWVF